MCGISGIIYRDNQAPIKEEIKRMNDLIIHRGPDDEGYFLGKNFAFGHRRLSIIDLSKAGHQPMVFRGKNGEYVITYNGEIYNYVEIREELLKDGYQFKSNTDTEVVLASYDKWGEDCVTRFNGMWSFAIYDKKRDIIFCSRDRFGIKPFYYIFFQDKFIFSSEIKQLLIFLNRKILNINILVDYLLFSLEEHTKETFFENILKLLPSYNLIYFLKTHNFFFNKYYTLQCNDKIKEFNEKESIELYRKIFNHAINIRLRSDVKVGTCLSGGLDSSSIASIASEKYFYKTKQKFIAIHAKSIDRRFDESKYAEIVAKYCNLDLKILSPSIDDFINNIKEVIYTQEEPFGGPSIFMQYFVMKKAKEVGCKVMLDGQGGDETLFGYEKYFQVLLADYFKKLMLFNYINTLFKIKNFKISKYKMCIQSFLTICSFVRYKRILNKSFIKDKFIDNERIKKYLQFKGIYEFQKEEIFNRSLPHLLKYEDKNSMRHSIETRLPFIDYSLVEFTFNLDIEKKFKNGFLKYFLRKVVEDNLPSEIVWRKDKFGFEAPTDKWITYNKDYLIKCIKDSAILNKIVIFKKININDLDGLWKLFNIAKWEEIFNVEMS